MKIARMNVRFLMFFAVLFAATSSFAVSIVDGVYQIGSCKDLIDFATVAGSNKSAHAVLTASFDMNDAYSEQKTCNGVPFRGIASGYTGHFDGRGFTISNLLYDDGGSKIQDMGLFNSITTDAVVENIVLENVTYISNANGSISSNAGPISLGPIVGWMPAGTIQNCFVSGTISTKGKNLSVGGIVGYMDGGIVQDCLSAVNIDASNDSVNVGGIAGSSVHYKNRAVIERCVYDGTTLSNLGNGPVGGIVGNATGIYSNSSAPDLSGNYYNASAATDGVGTNASASGVTGADDLNTPLVACSLNQGSWDDASQTCSESRTGTWGNGSRLTNTGVSCDDGGAVLYSISFNANGGSFSAGAKTEKFLSLNDAITDDEIGRPSRSGYTFRGWSLDPAAENPDASMGTVSKGTKFYAVWQEQETVTFVANSNGLSGAQFADGNTSKTMKMDYGAAITAGDVGAPVDFTIGSGESKVYYTFMGWSLYENATEPDANLGTVEGDVTVYAVWQITQSVFYTVTFNANNHGTAPLAQRVELNHLATQPSAPVAEGFTFAGWFSNSYGTGAAFNFETNKITSDITLYAKWNAITYNVAYHNMDDAANDGNPVTYTALDETIVLQKPTKTGFTFKGWFYDEGLTNPATGIVTGSVGEKHFYASWDLTTYTVTFVAGSNGRGTVEGNAGADKSIKVYGADLILPKTGFSPISSNTRLGGWNYTDGGSICDIKFVDGVDAKYTLNADATLYPCWVGLRSFNITYTLHFVNSDGEKVGDDAVTRIPQNETLNHIIQTPSEVAGFTFNGWIRVYKLVTAKMGEVETTDTVAVDVSNGKFTMPASDVYIEGTSVLNTYTIAYSNLGSQANTENATQYTVLSSDLALANPGDSSKSVFVGWYDNAKLSGEPVTAIAAGSTGNKTLYAKWRRVDYGSVQISADGKLVTILDNGKPVELTEEGVNVEQIHFERQGLKAGTIATIVLPFDLPEETTINAKFYSFNRIEPSVGKWKAYFSLLKTLPVADEPYVFILNSDATELEFTVPEGSKAVVHSGAIQSKMAPSGDWTFIGSYEFKQWNSGDPELGLAYGFSAVTNDDIKQGQFGQIVAGATMNPTRAYLKKRDADVKLTAPSSKPDVPGMNRMVASLPEEVDVVFEDGPGEIMAIGKLNTVTGQLKINRWTDLKGRRSSNRPSVKGVYFNGR